MSFNPGLKIGQILKNNELVEIFKCGNMGGMRRSKATNTLVIVTDHTKGLYKDKWKGGVLHYTGMGKVGDQDLYWSQNATLANCCNNGVDVHLFEVMNAGEYIYCGIVELIYEPYIETQKGDDGRDRKVWIFPIRPISNSSVKKPTSYIYKDTSAYKNINIHASNIMESKDKNNKGRKQRYNTPIRTELKPSIKVSDKDLGRQVKHRAFGMGIIKEIVGNDIIVEFEEKGKRKLGYELCIENGLIEFV